VRIAQVTPRFGRGGGIVANVRETSRRLIARGHQVEVFTSKEAGSDDRGEPLAVHRFSRYPTKTGFLYGATSAIARYRPNVIHAHSHRYGHVIQAAQVASRLGCPLVVSLHYHPAEGGPAISLAARVLDHWFRRIYRREHVSVIVQTETERGLVGRLVPPDRVLLVPPGLDTSEWKGRDEPSASLGLPKEYIVFAGRIDPSKGLDVLLSALASLPREQRPGLALVGPDFGARDHLTSLARDLGIEDSLRWLGFLPSRAEYRQVLRGARALVHPSRWEAYGLVLLEAMAARTPVIATSTGAIPEVLGHGSYGTLVPYGDASALAAALGALRSEPDRHRRIAEAAAAHVAEFDWSKVVEKLERAYGVTVA